MSNVPTLEEMLKAGIHFGHRTSKWHPKMSPYVFTARGGLHVIDLRKTQKMLGGAMDFLKKMAAEDKTVVFVGTKAQAKKIVRAVAEEVGQPYVSGKWLAGTLTNFPIIRRVIKKYTDLIEERDTGKLNKYTKKERLEIDREIKRLESKVGGLAALRRLPDALFVWDIKVEDNAVKEAKKRNIPVIAICDTNVNPMDVKYIIPANDDATKGVKLIMAAIRAAMLEGKEDRTRAALANQKVQA